MREAEKTRTRERGAVEKGGYDVLVQMRERFLERQYRGKIVIKKSEREWDVSAQGRLLWYLHPELYRDTPLGDCVFFLHDIRTHSGKHTHQGGLVIFVVEGKGWTVIDGERHDWEAGDLILLPIKPGGVEHQHFNAEPGKPCVWLAYINQQIWDWGASELRQIEVAPDYQQAGARR